MGVYIMYVSEQHILTDQKYLLGYCVGSEKSPNFFAGWKSVFNRRIRTEYGPDA